MLALKTASIMTTDAQLDSLKFDANGLIPIIVQDARNGQVLMMAWANREALARPDLLPVGTTITIPAKVKAGELMQRPRMNADGTGQAAGSSMPPG